MQGVLANLWQQGTYMNAIKSLSNYCISLERGLT
jgi:hypothetical protein